MVPAEKPLTPEGPLAKSDKEIMEILEAFDLTRCAWSAAQLVGCDPKTVAAAPHPPRWCRGLRRSPARISAARSRAACQACRAAGGGVTARGRR